MENNQFNFNGGDDDFIPASDKQMAMLQKLGYQGDTTGLTKTEASQIIKSMCEANQQAQAQQQQNQNTKKTSYMEDTRTMEKQTTQNQVATKKTGYEITTRNDQEITISKETVSQYLGVNLTDPEFSYFFSVCKNYKLNPFLKEIYAIKFGNQPATFVIDYKVLQQAVDTNPNFDGLETGVLYLDANGDEKERKGAYILPHETLIGAWCIVHRKDRTHTNKVYALYSENVKTTKEGEINSNWSGKPVFMITKVAKAQAIRETFPNMFDVNVYTDAEFDGTNEDFKKSSIGDVNVEQEASGKKDIEVDFND